MSKRRKLPRDHGDLVPQTRDSEGHNTVILEGPDGPSVRRVCELVAEAFIKPCPPGHRVEHINGDLADDRAANLHYVPIPEGESR